LNLTALVPGRIGLLHEVQCESENPSGILVVQADFMRFIKLEPPSASSETGSSGDPEGVSHAVRQEFATLDPPPLDACTIPIKYATLDASRSTSHEIGGEKEDGGRLGELFRFLQSEMRNKLLITQKEFE
jgi:hypothetical protein